MINGSFLHGQLSLNTSAAETAWKSFCSHCRLLLPPVDPQESIPLPALVCS